MTESLTIPPAGRTPQGRFAPGASGNPSGGSKALREVVEAARAHTAAAVATLAEIATGKGNPSAARVAASVALLDRGWGKPAQPVEGESGPVIVMFRWTDEGE